MNSQNLKDSGSDDGNQYSQWWTVYKFTQVALNLNYISKDQNRALSALSYIYDIEANIK